MRSLLTGTALTAALLGAPGVHGWWDVGHQSMFMYSGIQTVLEGHLSMYQDIKTTSKDI